MSVIVPTYADRALRLQSALASIWAQDELGEQFEVEVIVVDDASLGPTEQVVRRFPGTRYVRLETNRGPAAARNAGLAQAGGKYVAFMDDDDLWLPHRLLLHVAAQEQAEELEVVYSQLVAVYRDGTSDVFPGGSPPSGWIFETVFTGTSASIVTMTVPMRVFDTVGSFDEDLPAGEDGDWSMRLALQFPFRYVPGPVTIYLPSKRDWTTFFDKQIQSWLMRRDKVLQLVRGAPNEAAIKHFVLCATWMHVVSVLFKAGEFEAARREFLKGLGEFPPPKSDVWARYRMRELIPLLALASDSPIDQAESLCAEVKRTGGQRSLRQWLEMRALLGEIWTAVALRLASGRGRNSGMAGSAAMRAILQNPLKPLSRPGLLRLLSRTLVPS